MISLSLSTNPIGVRLFPSMGFPLAYLIELLTHSSEKTTRSLLGTVGKVKGIVALEMKMFSSILFPLSHFIKDAIHLVILIGCLPMSLQVDNMFDLPWG